MKLEEKIQQIQFQNERSMTIRYAIEESSMWVVSRLKDDYHDIEIDWQIDIPTHTVIDVVAKMHQKPFDMCSNALVVVSKMIGLEISIGVKKKFHKLFPKEQGCTHISELAMATFDFIVARAHGPKSQKLSETEKDKIRSYFAQYLCKNNSCVIFNQDTLEEFDERGSFKGQMYEY